MLHESTLSLPAALPLDDYTRLFFALFDDASDERPTQRPLAHVLDALRQRHGAVETALPRSAVQYRAYRRSGRAILGIRRLAHALFNVILIPVQRRGALCWNARVSGTIFGSAAQMMRGLARDKK